MTDKMLTNRSLHDAKLSKTKKQEMSKFFRETEMASDIKSKMVKKQTIVEKRQNKL